MFDFRLYTHKMGTETSRIITFWLTADRDYITTHICNRSTIAITVYIQHGDTPMHAVLKSVRFLNRDF